MKEFCQRQFFHVVLSVKLVKYIAFCNIIHTMKEVLYEVRCLKSTEDMILALAGQFKQLSHEPEKFR